MTNGWNFLVLNWQLLYKNLLDGQFPWVIYSRQSYCSYNQFNNGCRSGYIFTARDKLLARNENQREKRQHQQKQRKTNKNKHLKKTPYPWQHKNGKNTIETDQIDGSKWETQFYQNGNIRFGLLKVESHKNAEFEQKVISLEERVGRDREFTYVLNKQKNALSP